MVTAHVVGGGGDRGTNLSLFPNFYALTAHWRDPFTKSDTPALSGRFFFAFFVPSPSLNLPRPFLPGARDILVEILFTAFASATGWTGIERVGEKSSQIQTDF